MEKDKNTEKNDIEITSRVSSFGEPEKNPKKSKSSNSIHRQIKITAICVLLFAVLAVLYFVVLKPMTDVPTIEEYEILDGEAISIKNCTVKSVEGDGTVTYSSDEYYAYCNGGNATITLDTTNASSTAGGIYIFPMLEASDVEEVSVTNDTGTWGFKYDADDEDYYITGYKGTPYQESAYTALIAAARNPLSIERIAVDVDDMSKYGISSDGARYTITAFDGTAYTVYVGDMLVTGGGYYCALEGRNAVYAMDTSMAYFTSSVLSYINPLLSFPVSDTEYYNTEKFTLTVDGNEFVSFGYATAAEKEKTASNSTYKMFYPENYTPNTSNTNHILESFVEFEGTQVLAFGPYGETMSGVELSKYNLLVPKYEIYYRYSNVDNYIYVSEQNEDGSYYAYSLLFNIVCLVDADTVDYLRWDLIDFIDKPLFQKNINDVASVRIQTTQGGDETFIIKGDSNENLTCTVSSTGEVMDDEMLKNFRRLYIKLLNLQIEEYTESKSTDEWLMTLTVTTDFGYEYQYSFYAYSTRRCYFTINGEGEFYCLRDRVEKIIEDLPNLLDGKEIDSNDLG